MELVLHAEANKNLTEFNRGHIMTLVYRSVVPLQPRRPESRMDPLHSPTG